MSLVSQFHNMNLFIAGKSEPLTGQRLAKIGYKKTKDNPNPLPSVCVSVPHIDPQAVISNINRLLPYIGTMLENAQDGIIRSLYESKHGALTTIHDADISVDACIAFLEAESTGGRLTGDFLGAWFDANMAENLTVVIADKLKFDLSTPEQEQTVAKHLNGYKGLIVSLAGNKTILQPNQIAGIRKALEVSANDDATVSRLRAKLDAMEKKEKIEDLLEL